MTFIVLIVIKKPKNTCFSSIFSNMEELGGLLFRTRPFCLLNILEFSGINSQKQQKFQGIVDLERILRKILTILNKYDQLANTSRNFFFAARLARLADILKILMARLARQASKLAS